MKYKYLWVILGIALVIAALQFWRSYQKSTVVRQQSDIRSTSAGSNDAAARDAIQSDSTP